VKDLYVKNLPVGIFDSGVGGLTVFKEIRRFLPKENLIYVGDLARVPYGSKSPGLVRKFSLQIASFLNSLGIKSLVVACNTSSATSLELLKRRFSFPVIGVIEPSVEEALKEGRRIGIIATPTTIKSGAYQKAILKKAPEAEVIAFPAPLLVPLVEEGWIEDPITLQVLKRYLSPFKEKGVDTLILGCTHYPLLRDMISKEMGEEVRLVDSATSTAYRLKQLLSRLGLEGGEGREEFFLTDDPERFHNLAVLFLGRKITNVKVIDLEEENER